jgi:hypothetical protein
MALFSMTSANNQGVPDISDNSKNQTQMMTKDDFPSFWVEFRDAIISKDYIKLMGMTNFPLKSHGKRDSDPQFLIYQERFYYFLRTCLNEDTGQAMDGETNLDFIKRTSRLEESEYYKKDENWRKVMAMEFQKINDNWKLTLIYFDTANYKDK